ncbi:MAG: beta-ketoacyl-[acyl-carrier-protein] synthase family protein [Clostridiales bacterium]|jgi:3-oxoacyl-[acyl-carrier-protein] synthase II|nr:beta-ketoacyl-[acyl-carrier-protein] synthase family protein [Clostridiales bacterium]
MSERVVCTGLGVATSIGIGKENFWDGMTRTKCGAKPLIRLEQNRFAQNRSYEIDEAFPQEETIGRTSAMALHTIKSALTDAFVTDRPEMALIIGTGLCDFKKIEDGMDSGRFVNYKDICSNISERVENVGYGLTISTGCASGNYAVGYGYDLISAEETDIAVAGGCDCVTSVMYGIFDCVNREKPIFCQPFDVNRKGTILGDGAAFLVLESLTRAKRRNAPIYGEIIGYGLSCDAKHPTSPDPDGIARAMRSAIQRSRILPEDIDYIVMHGTGTALNDVAETRAVKEAFGSHSRNMATSSIKAMIGHTGGAAGTVSCVSAFLSIKHGKIPPTIFLESPDSLCDLDYTPNVWRNLRIKRAMINAFGFGGNNCCVVVGSYEGDNREE